MKSKRTGQQIWRRLPGALALLAICVLGYGLTASRLGYYWDDWFSIYAAREIGLAAVIEGFRADRPLLGYWQAAALSLLGVTPLPWHILALLLRWLSALLVWWTLAAVWPAHRREAAAVALVFAVYPGYLQQSLGFIYGLNLLPAMCLFLFSLGASLWSLRPTRMAWVLRLAAVFAALVSMLMVEYFLGLELLRSLLVWLLLGGVWQVRLRRAAIVLLPFYLNIAIMLLWRVGVVDQTAPEHRQIGQFVSLLLAEPRAELTRYATFLVSDLYNALIAAWWRAVPADLGTESAVRWLVSAAAALAAGAYFFLNNRRKPPAGGRAWYTQAILIGLAAIVFGQLPLWLADRRIEWINALDRHALPAMLGASLTLVGGIEWLARSRRQAVLVVSLAAGMAAGFHFQTGQAYVEDWALEKDFLWQMHWRAPGLQPGTTLLIHQEPAALPQPKDYTLAMPLNKLYGPPTTTGALSYWAFVQQPPYSAMWLAAVNGERLERTVRELTFSGDGADILVVAYGDTGCLRVLDPFGAAPPGFSAVESAALTRSDLSLITATGGQPPPREVFGPEPPRGWCYYFQKAEYARQLGDWETVAALGDQAQQLSLGPRDQTEWLVFLEAYLRLGNGDEARRQAQRVFSPDRLTPANAALMLPRQEALCGLLANANGMNSGALSAELAQAAECGLR